jgi:hypothetical protein
MPESETRPGGSTKNARPLFRRQQEIQRLRGDLERDGYPRFQMFLLVLLTGAAGFFASYAFLHAGVVAMWLRYLMSFVVAYIAFLILLWLWLRTRPEDFADIGDLPNSFPSSGSSGTGPHYSGHGGEFDGGGGNAAFDVPTADVSPLGDAGGSVGDALGAAAQAEEFAIPLVALILIGVLLLSSFFMVYSAPSLFAELLVDGVLSASLYRRLRGLETRHWLETAVRRTVWQFALTAALVSATGWGMALHAPGAHTLGDVISHARHGS